MADRNFNFGVSLVAGPENPLEILDVLDSSLFGMVEITGAQSEIPGLPEILARKRLSVANIRNFIDRTLTVNVCDQPEKIRREFISCLKQRLSSFRAAFGSEASSISLDFSVENGCDSPLFEDSRVDMIKTVSRILYELGSDLSLSVRIPSGSKAQPAYFNSLVPKILMSNVRLSLDIHPHEIARGEDPAGILRPFRFTAAGVILAYEAETGNLLVEKLLDLWLDLFASFDLRGRVLFCPSIKDPSHFISEIERLGELLAGKSRAPGVRG